jgi:dihydroflavonol-4-reductase
MANKPAPRTRIPYAVAFAFGAVSTGWGNVTGREPIAPLEAVRMARKKMFVTPAKAIRELAFAPQPVDEALRRALAWFQANHYC